MKLEQADILITIYTCFANTKHGRRLANEIRYARYNNANVSNQEWVNLLGSDVNNLSHMLVTACLTEDFCSITQKYQPGFLSEKERALLSVAAVIHDQGEAIIGDITYSDKNNKHEVQEEQAFKKFQDEFSPNLPFEIKEQITLARSQVVFNSHTKLGKAFNAIERIGYLRTALRAEFLLESKKAGNSAPGLRWLVADVLTNQICQLVKYSKTYVAVNKYLADNNVRISRAFSSIRAEDFASYSKDQKSESVEALNDAQVIWSKWNR